MRTLIPPGLLRAFSSRHCANSRHAFSVFGRFLGLPQFAPLPSVHNNTTMRTMKNSSNNSKGCFTYAKVFLALLLVAFALPASAAVGTGTVPILTPSGGFAIDGDLLANSPTSGAGDWLTNSAASGTNFVLKLDSTTTNVVNPFTTYHVHDTFNTPSGVGTQFATGSKGDQYYDGGTGSGSMTWTPGEPNDKTDIDNGLVHVGRDSNGHFWAVVAGDRSSVNGDAYLDFEFLQNTLVVNAIPTGATVGSFTGGGPHGGRTVGDLLVTIELTGGGSTPGFFLMQWQTNTAHGGWDYFDITTNATAGTAFAAENNAVITLPSGYTAFGTNTYAINQYGEAGIDLSALIAGIGSDPCTFGIKTIFVRSKTSQSASAVMKDFISPISVDLHLGAAITAVSTSDVSCNGQGNGSITVTATGAAPIAYSHDNGAHLQTNNTVFSGLSARSSN